MQYLVLLILSSFFFVAPLDSNAGEVSGKQSLLKIKSNSFGKEISNYPIDNDYAASVTRLNNRKSTPNQSRIFPHANFVNPIAFIHRIQFLTEKKHFVQPYLYCKPIGLKLIFPQHYYW